MLSDILLATTTVTKTTRVSPWEFLPELDPQEG